MGKILMICIIASLVVSLMASNSGSGQKVKHQSGGGSAYSQGGHQTGGHHSSGLQSGHHGGKSSSGHQGSNSGAHGGPMWDTHNRAGRN